MVARSPPKQQRKMALLPPHLSPTLLRETVNKVDKCMARLQELQHTVTGGSTKAKISGLNSSPPSSRGYFQSSLRCKQESSLRIRNGNSRRSPAGKLPAVTADDWRRMSLPAMLLGETMGEVLQATQFARTIVEAAAAGSSNKMRKPASVTDDPKTPPVTQRRKPKASIDHSMQARRIREKQVVLHTMRSEPASLKRAKSKINFKAPSSPLQHSRECEKENCQYVANRVSPRNRPWARKAVLFPNPLYNSKLSSPPSHHQKLGKTKSPVIVRSNKQTPHKFLIKSPPKIKSPPGANFSKKKSSPPPKDFSSSSAAARIRRSFSPSRLANRLVSPLKSRKMPVQKSEEMKIMEMARSRQIASYKFLIKSPPRKVKSSLVSASPTRTSSFGRTSPPKPSNLRRSFSPSRLANRIVMSPFKTRSNSMKKYEGMTIVNSGLNQRPISSSTRF